MSEVVVTGESRNPQDSGAATNPRITLNAIVFDLDGVLVNSLEVMRLAFHYAFHEVVGDGEPPFEEYREHLGGYFPEIMRKLNLPLAMEEPFVRESYRLASRVELFPGVRETLSELRDCGIRSSVATGKSGPRARSLLDGLGVLDLVDHVIGSDEVDSPKPAPDIVLRALELMEVDKGSAIMVGDAVYDIQSARAAGVTAVAALWGECDRDILLAAQPDISLERLEDLLGLVQGQRVRQGENTCP